MDVEIWGIYKYYAKRKFCRDTTPDLKYILTRVIKGVSTRTIAAVSGETGEVIAYFPVDAEDVLAGAISPNGKYVALLIPGENNVKVSVYKLTAAGPPAKEEKAEVTKGVYVSK